MNQILSLYNQLTATKAKLQEINDLLAQDPSKQLQYWSQTSQGYATIDELTKSLLQEIQLQSENLPNSKKIADCFKDLDILSTNLVKFSRNVITLGDRKNDLDYLQGMAKLQDTKNKLIEDVVNSLQEVQPTKKNKKVTVKIKSDILLTTN